MRPRRWRATGTILQLRPGWAGCGCGSLAGRHTTRDRRRHTARIDGHGPVILLWGDSKDAQLAHVHAALVRRGAEVHVLDDRRRVAAAPLSAYCAAYIRPRASRLRSSAKLL